MATAHPSAATAAPRHSTSKISMTTPPKEKDPSGLVTPIRPLGVKSRFSIVGSIGVIAWIVTA